MSGFLFAYCLNNPLIYTDPTGQTIVGDFFKWVKKNTWDEFWGAANNFAQWADQNGIPSVNVGYGVNSQGQVQPVGDINGHPLFSNEAQYEVAAQNAVNSINNARGDYFSQQNYSQSFNQYLNNTLMQVNYTSTNNYISSAGNWNNGFGTAATLMSYEFYNQSNHVIKWARNIQKNGEYITKTAAELTMEYQHSMRVAGKWMTNISKRSYQLALTIDSYNFMSNPSLNQGKKSAMSISYGTLSYLTPATIPYGLLITTIGPEPIDISWQHHIELYRKYNIPPRAWMH